MRIIIDLDDTTLEDLDRIAVDKKWYRKNTIEWLVEIYAKSMADDLRKRS